MSITEVPADLAFRVHAIPSAALAEIRLAGRDRFGNELTPIVDADGGRRSAAACAARRRASWST